MSVLHNIIINKSGKIYKYEKTIVNLVFTLVSIEVQILDLGYLFASISSIEKLREFNKGM